MTDFRLVPADTLPPAALHAAFTAAFADYLVGPFKLALQQWPQFLGRQGVELSLSRAALAGGEMQAFALTAPRTDVSSWRLGTMGALPASRGSGAARVLLDDFIERAREAGRSRVELECFAQNERALRLYRGRGFREVCELHGWRIDAGTPREGEADEGVRPLPLPQAYEHIDAVSRRRSDLPLQVTPTSLQAQPVALQAWSCGEAIVVAGDGGPRQLTLHSLVDETPRQEGARRLLRHLLLSFPDHAIQMPQLQRDDLGGRALQQLGFTRQPLHQVLMHRPFLT